MSKMIRLDVTPWTTRVRNYLDLVRMKTIDELKKAEKEIWGWIASRWTSCCIDTTERGSLMRKSKKYDWIYSKTSLLCDSNRQRIYGGDF